MNPRLVQSREEVLENKNRVAVQYGPLIYCFEEVDNTFGVDNISVPKNIQFEITPGMVLDEPVVTLTSSTAQEQNITAVPYYTWCNRGSNAMKVWINVEEQ